MEASDRRRLDLMNQALSDPATVRSLSQEDHATLVTERRQLANEIAQLDLRTTTEAEVTGRRRRPFLLAGDPSMLRLRRRRRTWNSATGW